MTSLLALQSHLGSSDAEDLNNAEKFLVYRHVQFGAGTI